MPEGGASLVPLRFLRNLGLVWVCGAVVVGAGWGGMWWGAGRKVRESVAAREALGMPVTVEGMRRSVPDERNAMVVLRRAVGALTGVDSPSNSPDVHPEYDVQPRRSEWWVRAEQSRAAHGRVFEAIAEARDRPDSYLEVEFSSLGPPRYGDLGVWTRLTRYGTDEALRRHFVGDDAGMFDLLEGLRQVARGVGDAGWSMGWWVRLLVEAVRVQVILHAGSGLRVGEGFGEVSRERVREEIAWLRQEGRETQARAMAGEVLERSAELDGSFGGWLLRPYAEWSKGDFAERIAEVVKELRGARVVGSAQGDVAVGLIMRERGPNVREGSMMSAVRRRLEFERRAAAVALAVALYRSEHGGRWPEGEGDLVPRYLAEMPQDPFGVAGERLEYRLARVGGEGRVVMRTTGPRDGIRLLGVPEGRRPVVLGRGLWREGVRPYRDEELLPMPSYDAGTYPEGEAWSATAMRPTYIDLGWWGSAWR